VYPADAQDLTRVDDRLVLVKVVRLGATESWTEVTTRLSSRFIASGCPAIPLGRSRYRYRVPWEVPGDHPKSLSQRRAPRLQSSRPVQALWRWPAACDVSRWPAARLVFR